MRGFTVQTLTETHFQKIKDQVCDLISRDLGQVDLVVYSLAAPTRILSDGE